ncbi:unnamed protein product [Chrysodeixis includens]|uniref:tRNA (guanine(9)-N(1))-methyltransferase n=1 Tax=Chrysodeixis includens TaxID=689277 RepID=A0A9N8KYS6_CHRIL|nr:unnamed protein product [Chrysodeixis includens]
MDKIEDVSSKDSGPKSKDYDENSSRQITLFDIKIDNGLKDDDGNEIPRPFTKSQMRKWLRKVKWENKKADKRAFEKAKAKARRKEAQEENISLGPSRKALKRMKLERPKRSTSLVIDLSFDHLMIEKDRFKVIKQILRCYSVNRRSENPVQFHLTSLGERTKSEMSRHNGYENWDINYHEASYLEVFPKENIVYLTSESDNVIEKIEENTAYIIGGLVDHNKYKGLCLKIAEEQGIRHAQLPLDKYINMKTRKVLTIDHVFEIMLRVCEGMPWQNVLLNVLPMRKGAYICDNRRSSNSSKDNSNSGEDE